MAKSIRYIIDADTTVQGSGMMLALYFMALILIIFMFKESKIKKSFALPSLIMLIIVYIFVPVKYHKMTAVYARFFWLLFTPIVTAVAFTYMIFKTERRKKRILLILLLFPLFFLCGKFQITSYRFKPYENLYRLPQAAVDITEKVLSENESPLLVVPYTIAHPFRQISTDVRLLYGEDATYGRIKYKPEFVEMAEEMERIIPDLNMITNKMREYGCDYIVFDTVYTELCENGNINVNEYPEDPDYVGDRTPTVGYEDLHDISVVYTASDNKSGLHNSVELPDNTDLHNSAMPVISDTTAADSSTPYWDLSSYDLEYDGTFGQYILYKYNDNDA